MKSQDYKVEVDDEHVIIWGHLGTKELLDLANYYYRLGYVEACIGFENSTLHLLKAYAEMLEAIKRG
jgi:hypothetical protein